MHGTLLAIATAIGILMLVRAGLRVEQWAEAVERLLTPRWKREADAYARLIPDADPWAT